jgi:hypothetical protein
MLPPSGFAPIATLSASSTLSTLTSTILTATSTLVQNVDLPSATVAIIAALDGAGTKHEHHPQPPPDQEPDNGECQLLGPFSLFIQAALGGLALLALVFKRWRERPQRPLKIWIFDVSKQVVGSILVHIANLVMSMLSSGQFTVKADPTSIISRMAGENYHPNPCSFYLLNLAIDVSIYFTQIDIHLLTHARQR